MSPRSRPAPLLADGFYINVHTTRRIPGGEVRGQIEPFPYFDQVNYIDEIDNAAWRLTTRTRRCPARYERIHRRVRHSSPMLGWTSRSRGSSAWPRTDQPSLESPGTTYSGRSIYLTFGLEGVNPPPPAPLPTERSADSTQANFVSREQLLGAGMLWLGANAGTAVISSTTYVSTTGLVVFEGAYGALMPGQVAVQYRWDFGDGSAYVTSLNQYAGHQYVCSPTGNTYTVRVEVTDSLGMVAIGSKQIDVTNTCVTEPKTIQTVVSAVDHVEQ